MKKNVSLLLFALFIFTVGSAFYLTRNSESSNEEAARKRLEKKVVLVVDSVEVK